MIFVTAIACGSVEEARWHMKSTRSKKAGSVFDSKFFTHVEDNYLSFPSLRLPNPCYALDKSLFVLSFICWCVVGMPETIW